MCSKCQDKGFIRNNPDLVYCDCPEGIHLRAAISRIKHPHSKGETNGKKSGDFVQGFYRDMAT